MRTTTLLCLLLGIFFSVPVSAQIQKGDILLGGSLGYYNSTSASSSATSSSSNANISPRISYGIGTNSLLGIKTGYSYSDTRSKGNPQKTVNNNFSAGVFWRKYFPIKNKIGWYAEPAAAVATGSAKHFSYYPINKETSRSVTVTATPGIYFLATPGILLSVDAGGAYYSYYSSKSGPSGSHGHSLGINLLNSFNFGIDCILGNKQKR